ncbi:Hypothetical predicted protein [Mytilus galloprovincialis]|uniref:Mab-21-like HhH/H2TH-like domain-containing protein n=1 Tax=Mytilus galloprovincialis TaxID=29158 RepID=A0A8B6FD13_MYTGA|nr:Hypothetical predicted protein [Mytilus galloprovincialis]
MDTNCRNQENDDHYNMYGIRKINYWDKYGVRPFPYRGKRRFTPSINQSSDGGIIISNDVFGLTIRQFEQTFKDCLEKRKKQEQWILNLRYPDKSSNAYLIYLQNCTDSRKDNSSWPDNIFKDKYVYEHAINTVGSEIDIRTRQRLLSIHDTIDNVGSPDITQILSGSLAEGLDLPGSDVDIMTIMEPFDVHRTIKNIKHPIQNYTLVMETDTDHPGFTRLRRVMQGYEESDFIPNEYSKRAREGSYLSVKDFSNVTKEEYRLTKIQTYSHGPCLSDKDQYVDIAFSLRSKCLPYQAIPWSFRHRNQWPPNNVIDNIINNGCLLVPIGPRTVSDNLFLWRLSFSEAEKHLVHSFNFTQLLCYGLLKLTLKRIINEIDDIKDLLCSYFLKTALFWVSEEVDIDTFQLPNLFVCLCLCLDKITSWVKKCYCPNYFIPEHNMFLGKITLDDNELLLQVLDSISTGGLDELISNLFPSKSENCCLLSTGCDISFIRLDFLFYRICVLVTEKDISSCYRVLSITESLIRSESCTFIIDACKYYHAKISQYVAQLLPIPTTNRETYTIYKLFHSHLQDGIKADAVSGWLLYASFYYMTGQYRVTLSLIDYVLSRITPAMMNLGCQNYDEGDINRYRHHVHNSVNLIAKTKIATVGCVTYMKQSPIIPFELQLEVENDKIIIPHFVLSHCLRCLCYHHLGDTFNRQQALCDLFRTVKNNVLIKEDELSDSVTILGVCYEISGDKDKAYQSYQKALHNDYKVCQSAEKRKLTLFVD